MYIQHSAGKYEITEGNISTFFNESNFVWLIDSQLIGLKEKIVSKKIIFLEADESRKNLETCGKVIDQLVEFQAKRDTTIIAIGGGFVQDIATFVSSLFMRGIKWIYVPSTLASMGDSCIGGKSSINTQNAKNLLGNFYPPQRVIVEIELLNTLPKVEIAAGLSEIIKICYAKGEKSFSECMDLLDKPIGEITSPEFSKLVFLSLETKKYFVENDEFDQGIRKLLNFGHTYSHALEAATNFELRHGLGVLLGMVCAVQNSNAITTQNSSELKRICVNIIKQFKNEISNSLINLDWEEFSEALFKDKKNTSTHLNLILPDKNGLCIRGIPFEHDSVLITTLEAKKTIEWLKNEVL